MSDTTTTETETETELESTTDSHVSRRSALRTIGAGAALVSGLGIGSATAAARPAKAQLQRKRLHNLAIYRQRTRKYRNTYIYAVDVKNRGNGTLGVAAYGYGRYNVYVPRDIPAGSTYTFVLRSSGPLDRIVFKRR